MRIRLSRPKGAHMEAWRQDHEHTKDEGFLSEGAQVDSIERRDERTLKVKSQLLHNFKKFRCRPLHGLISSRGRKELIKSI